MERPGQWPRSGGLRRRRDPALEPPWAAPVGHGYGMPLLDPDTTHLNKRPANARAGLNLRPSPTSLVAQRSEKSGVSSPASILASFARATGAFSALPCS